jgi:hypothetical protein
MRLLSPPHPPPTLRSETLRIDLGTHDALPSTRRVQDVVDLSTILLSEYRAEIGCQTTGSADGPRGSESTEADKHHGY